MRRPAVRLLVVPLATVALVASAVPAFADNLSNSLGANGTTTITLSGPGAGSTSINYWIDANNSGGQGFSGCDASDATAATVTIQAPPAVTVTPSPQIVFTQCGSATSNTRTVTFSSASAGDFSITATISDPHGRYNTDAATFTLHVVRPNTPPTVLVSGAQQGASYEKGAVPAVFCNVSDLEDGASTLPAVLSAVTGPLSGLGLGTQTASCHYTDQGGRSADASVTYSIVDSAAPTLSVPGDMTREATTDAGASASWSVTATDAVDPNPTVSCTAASGATFPLGATPVTCTATDAAGNSTSGLFSVVVQDTTNPSLHLPGDLHVEATGPAGATAGYTVTAHDSVDGDVTPACVPPAGSVFALGRTPVNCTATDARGNATAGGFNVTVIDTTAPLLHLPGAHVLEAADANGTALEFTATASDLVSGAPAVSCDSPSGTTFALGTTTVSCSAIDAAGNRAAGSFTVTVRDTTAPVLTLPADLTKEASKPQGADIAYAVSASDAVDGTVAVQCAPANGTLAIGSTTVACTATDGHGNSAGGSFTVTVVDTTPPVFADVPGGQLVEATGPGGAPATFTAPTAGDLVDGDRSVNCDAVSGATFALGATTVTCTAADTRGNAASVTFTITVVDTTAPVLAVPDNQTAEASGPTGAAVTWTTATAYDAVSGDVAVGCNRASGSVFPIGVTTVTCIATDAHGNAGSAGFTVSVQDSTAPDVTVPDNRSVEATGPHGAAAEWSAATATDTVDGALPAACDRQPGDLFPLGATTVRCSAVDAAGNTGYGAFVVTVVDTTAPELTVPAGHTAEATGPQGAVVDYAATATDLVDGPVTPVCTPAPAATFGLGETAVTCTATDAHGNATTKTFAVTVVDTTAPILTVPANPTVEATGPLGATVDYAASSVDLVDGPVATTCTPAAGNVFPLGVTTVACTATDAHGNAGSAGFTVTVVDTTAPELDLPTGLAALATSAGGARVSYRALAADAVSGPSVATCTPASGSVFAPGRTTVTCHAVDAAGNRSADGSFVITVTFEFGGFLAPVDRTAVNVIKGGSTVPMKWQLPNQSGGYLGDLAVVSSTASGVVACTGGNADDLTQYATGGTSLRYDSTANQYIYNWQSPKAPGKCYQVVIALTDGRTYSAVFQLR